MSLDVDVVDVDLAAAVGGVLPESEREVHHRAAVRQGVAFRLLVTALTPSPTINEMLNESAANWLIRTAIDVH